MTEPETYEHQLLVHCCLLVSGLCHFVVKVVPEVQTNKVFNIELNYDASGVWCGVNVLIFVWVTEW